MARRELRVFGWMGQRIECPAAGNGSRQTREIVAAYSKADAARAAGKKAPTQAHMWNLSETGNDTELSTALQFPGVVFWRPLDERRYGYIRAGEKWKGGR